MTTSYQRYQQRLSRVVTAIHVEVHSPSGFNPERLRAERLADVACLSVYHWHRVYHAMMGETVLQTINRVRLHDACRRLLYQRDQSIRDIAKQLGYASVPSFSRAFRQHIGLPPAVYRRERPYRPFEAPWSPMMHQTENMQNNPYTIAVVAIEPTYLVGFEHTGDYMQIGEKFHQLRVALSNLAPEDQCRERIAIYLDDPVSMPPEELRSAAGIKVDDAQEAAAIAQRLVGTSVAKIMEGEYARLSYQGPYAEIGHAYAWLYGCWLPNSGRLPADMPVFEHYLNAPQEVAHADLLTDIYIPLAALSS